MKYFDQARIFRILPFLLTLSVPCLLTAQIDSTDRQLETSLRVNGQWFLAYQYLSESGQAENQFTLKRGYLTFQKDLSRLFTVRFTQDITLDEEGGDAGNVEMRLKYLFLRVNPPHTILGSPYYLEFGMVHRPWLAFEESINRYRFQGTMLIERQDIMNSADFGVTLSALLGGTLDQEYQRRISSSNPGKYGSLALGVYNGGGYHARETNDWKNLEGRLTLRPFPDQLPGLQFSYNFLYGKGNIAEKPDFWIHHCFISYESLRLIATAQYFTGMGNSYGTFTDASLRAEKNRGYSFFGEWFLYRRILSLISRYDHFVIDEPENLRREILIAGFNYQFLRQQKVLFDIELTRENGRIRRMYELVLELRF